jgi:hypothetical protein
VANPRKESPKWSEDEGIVVKRSNRTRKRPRLKRGAWSTGSRRRSTSQVLVYDDLVTRESVSTPEMMAKTTEALALSYNLGSHGGKRRFIGTRYHYNDSYKTMMERNTAKPRIYPATKDGKVEGEPVFLTREELAEKRRGPGALHLRVPDAARPEGRRDAGLQGRVAAHAMANARNEHEHLHRDRSGIGQEEGFGLHRGMGSGLGVGQEHLRPRHRSGPAFADAASRPHHGWHRKWQPIAVGYEHYGMQADIEHIRDRQDRENYRFQIIPLGGAMPKLDRIRRLIPWFEQGRIFMPQALVKTNYEGRRRSI